MWHSRPALGLGESAQPSIIRCGHSCRFFVKTLEQVEVLLVCWMLELEMVTWFVSFILMWWCTDYQV